MHSLNPIKLDLSNRLVGFNFFYEKIDFLASKVISGGRQAARYISLATFTNELK